MDLLRLLVPPEPPAPGTLTLVRATRRAMATTFEIALPFGTPRALEAAEAALDTIDAVEDQLTVYRDTSEVSRLNAAAAERAVEVSPDLFALLTHCATLTRDTAGAFDAATGALTRCWGFHTREGRLPPPADLSAAMARTGFRHVILDADRRTVKYRRAGLEVNFGAIGKGYALDRAADVLTAEFGVRSALLHGGSSSVRAIGRPPTDLRGWAVSLRHPTDESRTLGTVYLADEALGTSAATVRHFEYNGKRYGHVLDPRTGRPASGVQSATCVAPTAADADALSTALFVAGETWATDHLKTRPHLAAVLLADDAETPTAINLPVMKYDPPGLRERMASVGIEW